jgi:hypothetical protein
MKLEQQVCSLELAQKLKELGVKQDSLWWWGYFYEENNALIRRNDVKGKWILFKEDEKHIKDYSAFTVAELGEILPEDYYSFRNTEKNKWWVIEYEELKEECDECGNIEKAITREETLADTEANARAKMLIWLIENKYITILKNK